MKYAIWGIVLMMTGCQLYGAEDNYSAQLQKWVGQPENALYQSWGLPDKIVPVTSAEKLAVYVTTTSQGVENPYSEQLYYQGMGDDDWWNDLYGPPVFNQPQIYYCKTSFVIKEGIVVNFNFNGDNCVYDN